MDRELEELLNRARSIPVSEAEREEHRIALAAANGRFSNDRVTVEAVRASRTISKAAAADVQRQDK